MLTALAGLGSMAMSGLSTVGGWLGSAGSWIGSNLGGIGSALGGLGGLAGSLFGASSSSKNAKKMAALQYEYQKRAWQEGPSLQRKGLEAAGYNPMLALNGNSASFMPSASYSPMPDIAGSAKAMSSIGKDILGLVDAQRKNVEADTKLKEGQLSAVETQRLQTETNTSLLQSQTARSDLAYGRDIVDTITDIAGTAGSLYSAKAMRDIARSPKETVTTIHHGDKTKPTEIIRTQGAPAVDSSAKGSSPNAAPAVGSSAKSAGRIAKELAKDIVFSLPLGIVGAGVGAGMSHVREREAKEHLKKSKDTSRKWYHNFDRFHFDY